ncbi:MAG: hypothetical protein ABIC68_02745 [Candidatus Omnitrophota bacterium]
MKLFQTMTKVYNACLNRRNLSDGARWDFYSCFILFAILLCQASNWFGSPLFMDCYYHLCVVRGFSDAGGWVGEAFWEYAPVGRPHLYPPFFHLFELMLFDCGVRLMTIARLFDFITYPFLLGAVWFVLRLLCSKRIAFFSLLLLSSSFSLFIAITSNIPCALAFLFGLFSFVCLRKKRVLSASLLLALSFYTHSLMSWLFLLAFFLYCGFERKEARRILLVCLSALVLAAPLLWHEFYYVSFIRSVRALEFYYADLSPVLYILSLAGIILCFRKKRSSLYFFIILMLAMSVLLFTHRDRFLSGIGLIPISILAALSLDELWAYLKKRNFNKRLFVYLFAVVFVFYFTTPIISLSPFEQRPVLSLKSSFINRWGMGGPQTAKAETIYYAKIVDELIQMMKENSLVDDIFFFNYPYGGGMMSALAHRAMSTAMLVEVKPFYELDPVMSARFVFLFKDPKDVYYQVLPLLIDRYGLKEVAQNQVACLYEHRCSAIRRVIKAVVPAKVCFILLFLVFVMIVADISFFSKSYVKRS